MKLFSTFLKILIGMLAYCGALALAFVFFNVSPVWGCIFVAALVLGPYAFFIAKYAVESGDNT
jgi:hypothetical protein